MKIVSFFHKDTGLFNGEQLFASDETAIAANTPPDHIAIEGHHDHLSKRVDLAAHLRWEALHDKVAQLQPQDRSQRHEELDSLWAQAVVDYQPPAPSPDHEW